MSDKIVRPGKREAWKPAAIETLRDVASALALMADALLQDDGILGALAGESLAAHMPALPKHIRDVLVENLSDEAAAGLRADKLYHEAAA